jgi:hypothetical protein
MGTSNIIQYISDPVLNQKNALDTVCSTIHCNAVIVLQRGTHYCRANGVIGRYAAWCRPLYGVYSCVKRNSRGFVLQSRRRCQALCSHEAASGLGPKLYTHRYLCVQILQRVFSITWHAFESHCSNHTFLSTKVRYFQWTRCKVKESWIHHREPYFLEVSFQFRYLGVEEKRHIPAQQSVSRSKSSNKR